MAADFYADSSFLVSLYRRDDNQDAANAFMERHTPALSFSPLNRIELRNALRNAASFGHLTEADLRAAFRRMDLDLNEGILTHLPVDWMRIFSVAEEVSDKHSAREGQRTIDLLHVAIALEAGAKTFLSFDHRQRRLAQSVGLRVKP